jgi:hypothetical protein
MLRKEGRSEEIKQQGESHIRLGLLVLE